MNNDRSRHMSWSPEDVEFDPEIEEEDEDQEDPTLEYLRDHNIEITRENYILHNWGVIPQTWTAEDEYSLPKFLQDWSWTVEE